MSESVANKIPTQCEAGGIRIRKYRSDDMQRLLDAVRESVRTVGRWQSWCTCAYDENDSTAWIENCIGAWDSGQRYDFAIVDAVNGGYLGGIGINQRNLEHNFANVGYWVRECCQVRGVATQAASLALGFAFGVLGLTRIEIIAAVDNRASRRVAEKVGATLEGIARNRLVLDGAPLMAAVYAMVPADYAEAQIRAISS